MRVNGTAEIFDDEALRAGLAARGRTPATVIRVAVRDTYLHCAKAMMRGPAPAQGFEGRALHPPELGADAQGPDRLDRACRDPGRDGHPVRGDTLARISHRIAKRGRAKPGNDKANPTQGAQPYWFVTVRRAPWPRSTQSMPVDPRPQPWDGEKSRLAAVLHRFAKRGGGDAGSGETNASRDARAYSTVRRAPWPCSTRPIPAGPRP